jgi:hypothetical protein
MSTSTQSSSSEATCAHSVHRPADEGVAEQAIRNDFAAVEAPSSDEGFEAVLIVM